MMKDEPRDPTRDAAAALIDDAVTLEVRADKHRRAGEAFLAGCALHDAASAALRAAGALANRKDAEPLRGSAHARAARLCLEAGRYSAAEAVIEGGMAGDPPATIRAALAGHRDALFRSDFGRARTLARALRCSLAACNGLPLELMSPTGRRYAIWHMDRRLRDREGMGHA
jgi:hypothetical protein